MSVIVAMVDGKEVVATKDLSIAESGKPVRIQAQHGRKYLLAEGEDALAPENITVKRVGKNLHVALEGTDPDDPQLIIEDFYEYDGQLIGMAEDATYHEYVAIEADQEHSIPFIMDGLSSVQALGTAELEGFADGLALLSGGVIPTSVLGLGALGLLGGAAAVGAQGSGGSSHHGASDKAVLGQPSVDSLIDDVGKYQGEIASGGLTDDSMPTLSGQAEPLAIVHLYDDGKLLGSSTVDSTGNWSFTPGQPLEDGKHTITVKIEGEGGNASEPSDYFEFTVDTVAPENKGIESVSKGAELIEYGGITSTNRPVLVGKGEPGSTVTILDNGSVIGEVIVNGEGQWNFIPNQELSDDSHSITVIHTDRAGNSSEPSAGYEVVVDTLSPDKPVILTVVDDQGDQTGALQAGDTTDDATPIISGDAEAGSTVVVYDKGVEIARILADDKGKWSFTPDQPMANGIHELTVKAIDAAGNTSVASDSFDFNLAVDAAPSPLSVPTIDLVRDDIGTTTGYLQSGDVTDDAKPILSGTSDAGTTVVIFDNGDEIGRVSVGESGKWTFEPILPLLNGEHVLSVVAVNDAGDSSDASPDFTFSVLVGGVPAVPAINSVKDDVGVYKGGLQKGDSTDDARPTIEGTARPGYIVSVYDSGVLIGTTTSDKNGFWIFTPGDELSDGVHKFTVTSREGDGPESTSTGIFTIIVDTQAPNHPEIVSVLDDHNVQQSIQLNGITDDSTPTFTGVSEPYGLIQVVDGDLKLGTVLADSSGKWAFTPSTPLSDGAHSITVTVTDEAGNKSEPSAAFTFTVNTHAQDTKPLVVIEGSVEAVSHDQSCISVSLDDLLSPDAPELFKEADTQRPNSSSVLQLEIGLDGGNGSAAEGFGGGLQVQLLSSAMLVENTVNDLVLQF